MRYTLNTDVPDVIKQYSKPYIEDFMDYLIKSEKVKSRTASRYQSCCVVSWVFFYNCYLHTLANKTKVMLTFDKSSYRKAHIVNGSETKVKVSYQFTRWFLDYLSENNLGGYELGGAEFESRKVNGQWKYFMVDTKPSIYTIPDKISQDMMDIKSNIGYIMEKNVIVLRGKDGKDITFRLDEYRKYIRELMLNYNKIGVESSIVNSGTGKDYLIQLTKIYNTNFDKGGRMYDMGIQSLSKQERKALTINGNETCIFDYKAFETSLIYSMQGESLLSDPYQIHIKGYDDKILREVGKMIMTRIYYCKNSVELRESVNSDLKDKFNLDKLVSEGKIPEKRIPTGYIIDKLVEKHECIMEHFYLNSDYDPSNLGSLVIDYILDYMMQNHKCLVIPVFDEIICDVKYEYEIQKVMKLAYSHVVGSEGNCMIVREK